MEPIARLATQSALSVRQIPQTVQSALKLEPVKHIYMEPPAFQPAPIRPTNQLLPIFAPIVILSAWSVQGPMIISAVHA